ncbi:MAG: hypothetical protein WDO73_10120 [Ignavibacteriota bacterium]
MATQIGVHSIGFTATDALGATTTASVPVDVESGDPVVTRIVNAASHAAEAACSPGALAMIEGRWLTEDTGTKVWANGNATQIISASPTGLTILCPDSAPGTELQFAVQTARGVANPLSTTLQYATPGIFTLDGTGTGQGAIVLEGTSDVAMVRNRQVAGQPAMPGDRIQVFATGIDRLNDVTVQIGQVPVAAQSIDAVVNLPGLYRVVLTVPDAVSKDGDVSLWLAGNSPDGATSRSNAVSVVLEMVKGEVPR